MEKKYFSITVFLIPYNTVLHVTEQNNFLFGFTLWAHPGTGKLQQEVWALPSPQPPVQLRCLLCSQQQHTQPPGDLLNHFLTSSRRLLWQQPCLCLSNAGDFYKAVKGEGIEDIWLRLLAQVKTRFPPHLASEWIFFLYKHVITICFLCR